MDDQRMTIEFECSTESLNSNSNCSEIRARNAFELLVLLLRIRTLASGGGGAAAAVSQ